MAGKQAKSTRVFDRKLFEKRVQRLRTNQQKNFYDWIERDCRSLEKDLKPFLRGKVGKERAAAELRKLLNKHEPSLKKLEKQTRLKKHYPDAVYGLLRELPGGMDPKDLKAGTVMINKAAERAEVERRQRENQVQEVLVNIRRQRFFMTKVYGQEIADPIFLLTMLLHLLVTNMKRNKR